MELTELVTYDGRPNATASLLSRASFWAGAILATLIAAGVAALLIVRKVKRQKTAGAPLAANGNGRLNGKPYVAGNGNGSVNGLLKMALAKNGKNPDGSKRKRTFNYNKYYADLMSQVSSGAYVVAGPANHHRTNGANGHSPAPKAEYQRFPAQPELPMEHPPGRSNAELIAELIANQKSLIEEQKRLMSQQMKLIEEKTRLIEEKSKMLEQQSELIGSNML
jgi:hypothetical protein